MIKFHLVRIRLNSGGYDSDGGYWGVGDGGNKLYRAYGDDAEYIEQGLYLRAFSRDDAKKKVILKFPSAKFFK